LVAIGSYGNKKQAVLEDRTVTVSKYDRAEEQRYRDKTQLKIQNLEKRIKELEDNL